MRSCLGGTSAVGMAILGVLAFAPLAGMAQKPSDVVVALFPETSNSESSEAKLPLPADAFQQLEVKANELQQRLDAVEARLGSSSRPPSAGNNMERRLADLEKRVQQNEQQLARMQQFDQRIRRLEMK